MVMLHGRGWEMRDGKMVRPDDGWDGTMRRLGEALNREPPVIRELRLARRAQRNAMLLCLAAVVLCLVAIVAARNPHALGLAADDRAGAMGTKGQVR